MSLELSDRLRIIFPLFNRKSFTVTLPKPPPRRRRSKIGQLAIKETEKNHFFFSPSRKIRKSEVRRKSATDKISETCTIFVPCLRDREHGWLHHGLHLDSHNTLRWPWTVLIWPLHFRYALTPGDSPPNAKTNTKRKRKTNSLRREPPIRSTGYVDNMHTYIHIPDSYIDRLSLQLVYFTRNFIQNSASTKSTKIIIFFNFHSLDIKQKKTYINLSQDFCIYLY